ncbi:DUF423 domain-containing protein [Hansschlegelia sp.]|uniref:DUF423 domain-containing protein n=1 Tax=Hansschlegelia sp. TaxID=2041892 RepID=UPI002D0D0F40|nr:DUF423 domain-containing protein [Hansschlegelia sp.]HVI28230.1 DUF423 domain-containing protein [Hansschlegelia sp.]
MSRSALLLLALAGLYGAAGVAGAAAGAHMTGDPRLGTASTFLMLNAAAMPGVVAASAALGRLGLLPAAGLALGALLFSGDLMIRVAYGTSPLPMAAPTGGVILILSWVAFMALAIAAALRRRG